MRPTGKPTFSGFPRSSNSRRPTDPRISRYRTVSPIGLEAVWRARSIHVSLYAHDFRSPGQTVRPRTERGRVDARRSRPHPGDRRPFARLPACLRRRRAEPSRSRRPDVGRGYPTLPVVRDSDRAQGCDPHTRHPIYSRLENSRRLHSPVRRDRYPTAQRRGCGDRGQGQLRRVRNGLVQREFGLCGVPQPVEYRPGAGRLVRWLRGHGRRGSSLCLARHRYWRLDSAARGVLRRRRPEAQLRARQPLRGRSVRIVSGSGRAGHQRRARLRPAPASDCRPRPARFHLGRRPGARLHRGDGRRRARRARRDSPRILR